MVTLADALRQTGYAQDGTLATPNPVESPMTKALADHIASIPQKFNENQAHQMSLLKQAFPGNTYESMMTQGDPKAMTELAMQAPFGAMIAYHGTPHNILGKFDINKVGTGEGAQSFGHGMYFAEAKPVAQQYMEFDGPSLESKVDLNRRARDFLNEYVDPNSKPAEWLKAAKEDAKKYQHLDVLAELSKLKAKDIGHTPIGGNLYKVDIPDEYIPNMLDWDKPISQQPKIVQDAFKQAASLEGDPYNLKRFKNPIGADFYYGLTKNNATDQLPKEASDYLHKLGIPGIRYLDAGSRPTNIMDTRLESLYQKHGGDIQKAADDFMRTIHESPKKKAEIRAGIIKDLENRPTSNFVVFDPSNVKILEKNDKPISRKELIEKQVNKLKD